MSRFVGEFEVAEPDMLEYRPGLDGWVDLVYKHRLLGSVMELPSGGYLTADALGNELGTTITADEAVAKVREAASA